MRGDESERGDTGNQRGSGHGGLLWSWRFPAKGKPLAAENASTQ
jgi:hypothetical protein